MLVAFKNILVFFFLFVCLRGVGQEYNFWNYTVQNGLVGSQVNTVFQDDLGFLWVGTESGVSKYDGTTFINYDKFDNLNANSVTQIIQDFTGAIWFGHRDGSITLYENNKFLPIVYESDSILNFSLNYEGNLLVTTKNSIYFLTEKQKQTIAFYNADITEFFIATKQLTQKDWLVVTNHNLSVYSLENNIPKLKYQHKLLINVNYFDANRGKFFVASNKGEILSFDNNFKILDKLDLKERINYIQYKDDRLFVSSGKGVFIVSVKDKAQILKNIITGGIGVKKTFFDKENILWMATENKGLLALPKSHFLKYSYESKLGNLISSSTKKSSQILVFEKGIGSIDVNSTADGFKLIGRFKKNINTALLTDKNEIWYGTNKGLFLRFSNSVIEYEFKEFKGEKINDLCLFNGNVLIATNRDLFVYKPSTNKVSSFTLENNLTEFSINSFNIIEGEIHGLGKGNIIKITAKEVGFLFNKKNELSELEFTALTKSNNKILIASQGKGIYEYYNRNSYDNLTEKLNTPHRYVISLQQINDSIIWYTTKQGIVKCNINTGDYDLYGQKYLGDLNFISKPPITQSEDCFFISDKGLILAEYRLFNTINNNNNLQITSFQVSGVEEYLTHNLELNFGKYPIQIGYELISLKDKSYFQYKLEGYSNYWSEPTTQKNVAFLNLTPGKYSFKVRTIDPKNDKVQNEKELNFVIKIPFWKTTSFFGVISLGLVLLFIVAYFFRILSLRVQKRRLEKQVEEKTFQLSLQKKQLEQFSYSLSHDLKNPVNNIKGLVEILGDNKSDEVITMLSQSTEVLENKILEALNAIKRTQANTQEIKQVVFIEIFEKVEKSLMMLIKENKTTLLTDFSVKGIQYEETLIESVLYNLISNAIKYKHPDRLPIVNVYTEQINDLVRLSITDNGLGLDIEKEKENLFSIFKRVHTNGEGTGIGLYMIKQMVEINGGSIDVESEIGEGTTFHVYLKPLKAK
jgi:signal transduction histidine kinase/ligand-binding sensor domain-containing protein